MSDFLTNTPVWVIPLLQGVILACQGAIMLLNQGKKPVGEKTHNVKE